MSLIKVVSLDVFGTLISPKIPVGACYSQFARESCGLNLPDKLVEENFFKVYKQMLIQYPNFGTANNMNSRVWWNKLISQAFGLCINKSDFTASEKDTDRLYNWYGTSDAWNVYHNTFIGLKTLKQSHIKIAALSNFDERLPKILNELELFNYFDKIVFSSSLPYWKPDHKIFQYLCQYFLINAENLLHCGDNYEKDYKAAVNFGAQAALFLPAADTASKYRESIANQSISPDHIIHSLDQLSNNIFKRNKV